MAAHPATGETFELNAIAAAVLGGTSMSGGRGTIGGTIIGAFVIGILSDGLVMMGVSSFWQMVIKGLVIIVAVVVDQAQRRLQASVALTQMAGGAREMTMLRGALIGCGFFAVEPPARLARRRGRGDRRDLRPRPGAAAEVGDAVRHRADAMPTRARCWRRRSSTSSTSRRRSRATGRWSSWRRRRACTMICQKPFASSMADARAMVAAAAKAGRAADGARELPLAVGDPAVRRRRDGGDRQAVLGPGELPLRASTSIAGQPYLATDERFIIQDLGIHILDVARFLFGDVATLAATTQRVNPAIRGEDVATMLLAHESGVTSVVDCSYASRLPRENFPETLLEIEGTEGSLRLDAGYRLSVHAGGETRAIDAAPPLLPWAERPWHNIQESVLASSGTSPTACGSGREPETSGADNLKTLALVDAAYDSAADGGRTIAMREYAG